MQKVWVVGRVAAWAVALVAASIGAGCRTPQDDAPTTSASDEPLVVNVTPIRRSKNVYDTRSYYGSVKPKRTSNLGFGRAGQIKSLSKTLGERAASGEELAAFDYTKLDEDLAALGDSLQRAEQRVEQVRGGLNVNFNQQDLEAAQQQVANLKKQQAELEAERTLAVITAPYDCFIAEILFAEGDSAPAGRPVIRVVESAAPVVEVNVAAEIAEQLQLDQPIDVFSKGSIITTTLTAKAPEITSGAGTVTLILQVGEDRTSSQTRVGDVVDVRFWMATPLTGFWIPMRSLQREPGGLWSAFVAVDEGEGAIVSRRTVDVLQVNYDAVLVEGSLESGEQLIIDGGNRIVPGQRVKPQDAVIDLLIPGPMGAIE